MKRLMLMPGLMAPSTAPRVYQQKAKQQVLRFRRGERNYKKLHVKGKHTPGRAWIKIDISSHWRLLSRNSGVDWELLTHERYNTELWK